MSKENKMRDHRASPKSDVHEKLQPIPKQRPIVKTADELEVFLSDLHDQLDTLDSLILGYGHQESNEKLEPKGGLDSSLNRSCTAAAAALGRARTLVQALRGEDIER